VKAAAMPPPLLPPPVRRTLQPVLDDVWRLLWLTAAAGTSAPPPHGVEGRVEGSAEEAPGPGGTAGAAAADAPTRVAPHSMRGGGGAHSVSVSACVRLVGNPSVSTVPVISFSIFSIVFHSHLTETPDVEWPCPDVQPERKSLPLPDRRRHRRARARDTQVVQLL
jgi:hypothetical protein